MKLLSKTYLKTIIVIGTILLLSAGPAISSDKNDIPENKTTTSFENNDTDNDDDLLDDKGAKFSFKGHFKNLFTYKTTDNFAVKTTSPPYYEINSKRLITDLKRIRLSPEFKYSDFLTVHIDYDNEIILSNFNRSITFDNYWRVSEYNDLFDMSWEPHYSEDVLYRTKIHRAYMKLVLSDFTITLGRQLIRFGSGRLWNPLDIMNPISPTFVEGAEDQKGTDALKVDYYFNDTTELTFVYDQKLQNDRYSDTEGKDINTVLRFKTTFFKTDFAVLGGYVTRKMVFGIDTASTLFDGMLRSCIIYAHQENGNWYFQGNIGYEYTFKTGIYLLGEYFYNGNSINSNDELKNAFESTMSLGSNQSSYILMANQLVTYNEHYMGIAAGYDFTALLRGDLFFIFDFQGAGFFIAPSLKYNIIENLDLMIGAMIGHAFDAGKRSSDFEEFEKNYMYYASLKLYF